MHKLSFWNAKSHQRKQHYNQSKRGSRGLLLGGERVVRGAPSSSWEGCCVPHGVEEGPVRSVLLRERSLAGPGTRSSNKHRHLKRTLINLISRTQAECRERKNRTKTTIVPAAPEFARCFFASRQGALAQHHPTDQDPAYSVKSPRSQWTLKSSRGQGEKRHKDCTTPTSNERRCEGAMSGVGDIRIKKRCSPRESESGSLIKTGGQQAFAIRETIVRCNFSW